MQEIPQIVTILMYGPILLACYFLVFCSKSTI